MKLTKATLKKIIKEEIGKVLSDDDELYEYYLDSRYEGIYSEAHETLEEAEESIKDALRTFYRGADLVAIFGPDGTIVKLGDNYEKDEAYEIHKREGGD